MALNLKRVAALIAKGTPCRVHDGRGLYLVVENPTSAYWAFRYQLHHRKHWMGLGSARTFSLTEARERTQKPRQLLADKVDPIATRQAERAAAARSLPFAEAARQWLSTMSAGWSPKHTRDTAGALTHWAVSIIGNMDVSAIDTPAVLRVLQQPVDGASFWTERTTTADRVRNQIKLVLDWAGVAGYRPSDIPNPARWAGHLALVLPSPAAVAPVQNQPSLEYQRVPELMTKLAVRGGLGAAALRFTVLTACRMSEATNARWVEFDLEAAIWTVPAARMKARKEWRQPLAPQVIEFLKQLPTEDGNPHVFIGSGRGAAITDSALRMCLQRQGYDDVVTHGFRSSFSTWAQERTAHSNHTIEMCLAHSVGNEIERAYRRSDMIDKRRRLMADWATYALSRPVESAVIVPIGGAR
jgi:integrase